MQPWKVESNTVILSGISGISVNFVSENAPPPKTCNPSGKLTLVIGHLLNAFLPIAVTDSGMWTSPAICPRQKALSSIFCNVDGNWMLLRPVWLKQDTPIESKPSGSSTEVKFSAKTKVRAPKWVIPLFTIPLVTFFISCPLSPYQGTSAAFE